jgi:hypothetical protein
MATGNHQEWRAGDGDVSWGKREVEAFLVIMQNIVLNMGLGVNFFIR